MTVDEVLAQELPAVGNDEDVASNTKGEELPDAIDADVLIGGAFDRLHFALQACEDDIERLVQLRLDTNAVIKLRRRQLAILQSQVNTYQQGMDALRDDQ